MPGSQRQNYDKKDKLEDQGDMDKVPSLDKKVVRVTALDDIEEERKCRLSKSAFDRIEAIEINRRMIYSEDLVTSRLLRILEVAEIS
jgi:hypothetical protein